MDGLHWPTGFVAVPEDEINEKTVGDARSDDADGFEDVESLFHNREGLMLEL